MKILKKIAQGGVYSNKSMAKELGLDASLVEQMITQLQQLGYIEKNKMGGRSSGCGCCSTKNSCCSDKHNIDINIWKITEKGKKAILG
jgi:predicted transcriptional regulator